jgi:hypothetical protein
VRVRARSIISYRVLSAVRCIDCRAELELRRYWQRLRLVERSTDLPHRCRQAIVRMHGVPR